MVSGPSHQSVMDELMDSVMENLTASNLSGVTLSRTYAKDGRAAILVAVASEMEKMPHPIVMGPMDHGAADREQGADSVRDGPLLPRQYQEIDITARRVQTSASDFSAAVAQILSASAELPGPEDGADRAPGHLRAKGPKIQGKKGKPRHW